MIYRIAICDDSDKDAQYISSMVSKWAKSSGFMVRIDLFPSAEAFLFQYEQDKCYDILLLDIEMGEKSGVELAKEIRRDNQSIQIVFITGYSDYIAEGYDVSALHYLIKPVDQKKLFSVLRRGVEKLQYNERTLLLEIPGEIIRIPHHEIRYLEVNQNYVTIHARKDHTVKKTLSQLEKELDDRFFRTGRSFIINLAHVRRVTKTDAYLSDGSVVPLPRGVYDRLNRAFIDKM